jgi:hypothetical protein
VLIWFHFGLADPAHGNRAEDVSHKIRNILRVQPLLKWNISKWSFEMFKNVPMKTPIKTLIVAGLFALTSMAVPTVADAKTRIGIYFGVPFYDGAVHRGYLYEPNYGWYAPEYDYKVRRNYGNSRVSCGQAARHLRNAGYRNVVAIDCDGRIYQFRANRNGRYVMLSYNARTRSFGRI